MNNRLALFLVFLPCLALGDSWLALEQFGGQAYYKRFDEGLTYTPYSVDQSITNGTPFPVGTNCTKITYTGIGDGFDVNDLNKSFCGLFVHQNPGQTDAAIADRYYPNIVGSRYAKVIRVLDEKNILVDFEYNGKSKAGPQVVFDQKGYIFFDNSAAWASLMTEYVRSGNTNTEIRLLEHTQVGVFQATYVIPQYLSYSLRDKELKIWTGTGNKARIKLGIEDYFQWAGNGAKAYKQAVFLFETLATNKNVIIHNVVWLPPHRTVPETSSFLRQFFGGQRIAPCERILAVIGNTALDEKREIESGAGLTEERIQCMGLGFIYSGGKYSGSGVAEDISAYQYVFIKDFEHTGSSLIDLKANSGAGNYLVMQNVTTDFLDQEKWRPTSILVDGRFTADKSGFDTGLVARTYYPDKVFEITSGHSFHQVDNSYLLDGWGNRANIIQIDRFAFTLGNYNTWDDIYEPVYSEGHPKFDWNNPPGACPFRTGRKHMMVQRIPRTGNRYTISRDYTVSGTNIPRTVTVISTNKVRGFANWSVILQKTVTQINPSNDIPENAKPIQLQAGDRFTIVGWGNEVYTVLDNDRGPYDQFAEYTGGDVYLYSRHTVNKTLPTDLPLAFEIEMVESTSEYLLDGEVRPGYLIYKSNLSWNSTTNTQFGDSNVLASDSLGHVSYNHKEFALWANNVKHNGFYRQSSNAGNTDPTLFSIADPDTGASREVSRLGRYSPGYVLINSSGFQGQFCYLLDDFYLRDKIQRALGMNLSESQKAKIRLYHCANISTASVVGAGQFIEAYDSDASAPDMPAPCRALLNALPAWTPGFTGTVWNGFSGAWADATQWGSGCVPGEGADVIFPPGAYTVTLSEPTSNLNSYSQYGGNLLVSNWTTVLRAVEVTLDDGTIRPARCDTNAVPGNINRVWIVATNLTVGRYAMIHADGAGFRGGVDGVLNHEGQGPGGAVHSNYGSAGGSYGGRGGDSYSYGAPRDPYGDAEAPLLPGSGGAGKEASEGGSGGGAILLSVGNRLTVHGKISANGDTGTGAGSGGSIYITCQSLAGKRGSIRAQGGNGTGTVGSGGGGGRVAILYDPDIQRTEIPKPSVAISAAHGSQDGYYSWAPKRDGKPGTVYCADSQLMPEVIGDNGGGQFLWSSNASVLSLNSLSIVDTRAPFRASDLTHNFASRVELPRVRTLNISSNVLLDNARLVISNCVMRVGGGMTLTNAGRFYVFAGQTNAGTPVYGALVEVGDRLLIASNSWIFPISHAMNGGSAIFRMKDMIIANTTNAGINADGLGYGSRLQISGINTNVGYGSGGGGYRSGGGYGGKGGGSYPGVAYGDSNAPTQCGSGGGFQTDALGYWGGGLVWIEATGTVSVGGSITARGESTMPVSQYTGAGSGGGIFIQCVSFNSISNAVLSADGGYGGALGAGGGGGGRIAVWYQSISGFPGSVSANGGAGCTGQSGSSGTVVFIKVDPPLDPIDQPAGTIFMVQ